MIDAPDSPDPGSGRSAPNVSIIVELSPEVERLLIENEVDLVSELQRLGLQIRRTARPTSAPPGDAGLKGVELTILAAATATPLIATGISRVIDALNRYRASRPTIVTTRKCIPVRNSNGELETGPNGQPLMEWSEVSEVVAVPEPTQQENLQVEFSFLGLKVSLGGKSETGPT